MIKRSPGEPSFPPPDFGREATVTKTLEALPEGADYGVLQVSVEMTHPSYALPFLYYFRVKTKAQQRAVYEALAAHAGERLCGILELEIPDE